MKAIIKIKSVHSLTRAEIAACRELNFGNSGMMRQRFTWELSDRSSDAIAVLFKSRNNRVLGWALVFGQHHRAKADKGAYLFVNAKWRKSGIGRVLLENIQEHIGMVQVFPHDVLSRYFFHNFKDNFAITEFELRQMEQMAAA